VSSENPLLTTSGVRQRAEQQRAIETVNLVLEATIERLVAEGEGAVNIKEIAAATGVSYGAIYHHFKDRSGLLQAAQFERLRRQPGGDIAELGSAIAADLDLSEFLQRVRDISNSISDPARASVRLVRSSVIASSVHLPELHRAVTELESEVMEEIAALIVKAQEAGIADPSLDPKAAAVYIEALSYGIVLTEFMSNPPTPEKISDVLFRGFLALVAPQPT
jgi:AcrR family transcriptional regulator